MAKGSDLRRQPDEDDRKDGITFDKMGRMQYNPIFHTNHGKPFTVSDLIYLCKYYGVDGARIKYVEKR